jgi:hypothetical protein
MAKIVTIAEAAKQLAKPGRPPLTPRHVRRLLATVPFETPEDRRVKVGVRENDVAALLERRKSR